MAKNIVFCADGTWNGPGQDDNADGVADPTNVLKLFTNLAGSVTLETATLLDEQEKQHVDPQGAPLQVAKYLHGVGDSRNKLHRVLGGVFGAGIIDRIVRGYSFVSRHYEPGDRIYLVGFSRGAYTARALGGLIASVGLLDRDRVDLRDEELRYSLGIGAWVRYRQKTRNIDSPLFGYLLSFVGRKVEDHQLRVDVPIRAIGVWDTVGAYGVPAYAIDRSRIDLFRFADCKLSAKVGKGFHAVSIDEQRADFTPTLWDEAPNVSQVWFAGAHSDVGGGYAEAGLSDIALDWMASRLAECGLLFAAPPAYAPKHDVGLDSHMPWTVPPFNLTLRSHRAVPKGSQVHGSVVERGNYNRHALQALLKGDALDPASCTVVAWRG